MPKFNVQAALQAGYSQEEINTYLNSPQAKADSSMIQSPSPSNKPQGNILTDLIGGLTKPFTETAKNIGALAIQTPVMLATQKYPEELPSWLQFKSSEQLRKLSANPLEQIYEQGVKPSAGVASWAVPFGKGANVLSKLLAPGAAVGGLQAVSEGEDVTKGAITGATGAGLLGGALGLTKGITKLAGKGLSKTGETLALKSLRPSPSQQAKFYGETGEKLSDYIKKKGFEGADYDKIYQATDLLQSQFDEVVKNKNIKVPIADIVSKFNKEIGRLGRSVLPAEKNKAIALKEIRDNFTKKYKTADLTADKLTTLRRDVDEGIKNFNLDETVKGPLNFTREILQGSLREAADKAGITIQDKTLKETGIELSKLYKLLGIAEKQQYLGKGSLPLGLSTLLGGLGGGIAGFGLPGAIAGGVAVNTLNKPVVTGALSKATSKAGEGIRNINIPSMGNKLGQLSARFPTLFAGQSNPNQQANQQPADYINNQNITPSAPSINQPVNQKQGINITPEQMQQVLLSPKISAKTKALIKQAYDLQTGSKPLNATQQLNKTNAESGLRALDKLESEMASDPSVLYKAALPGSLGARTFVTARKEASDVLTRLRTGAALSANEEKFYASQLPQPLDDPQTIQYKIKIFRDLFDQIANGQRPSEGEINLSQ